MSKKELMKRLLDHLSMAERDAVLYAIIAAANDDGILDYYDFSSALEGERR